MTQYAFANLLFRQKGTFLIYNLTCNNNFKGENAAEQSQM